jgi:hypothetical protein
MRVGFQHMDGAVGGSPGFDAWYGTFVLTLEIGGRSASMIAAELEKGTDVGNGRGHLPGKDPYDQLTQFLV